MRPDRAWVRLQSGKRLDLLDPDMAANSAQAKTLAMPNPPGTLCIQACIAE